MLLFADPAAFFASKLVIPLLVLASLVILLALFFPDLDHLISRLKKHKDN
ncbi:MAG: hypothetical protein KKH28_05815 [Elusimicrobia bacterium]|nr:hypothetical protein [Elusimicrobiota bacterium]